MWGEIRAPHFAFTDWIRIEPWFYPWYFVGIGQLLSFCLTRLPFCDFFWARKNKLFWGFLLLLLWFISLLGISGLWLLQHSVQDTGAKRKPSKPTTMPFFGPQGLLSSFYFSEFSSISVMYNVQAMSLLF